MRYCLLCLVRQDNRIGDTAGIYDLLQEYSSRKHPDSNVYRCGNERYVKRFADRFGEEMAEKLEFRTINGICAKIIQYYGRKIGKTPFELVKEEKNTTGMLVKICQEHGMGYPTESDLKMCGR